MLPLNFQHREEDVLVLGHFSCNGAQWREPEKQLICELTGERDAKEGIDQNMNKYRWQ